MFECTNVLTLLTKRIRKSSADSSTDYLVAKMLFQIKWYTGAFWRYSEEPSEWKFRKIRVNLTILQIWIQHYFSENSVYNFDCDCPKKLSPSLFVQSGRLLRSWFPHRHPLRWLFFGLRSTVIDPGFIDSNQSSQNLSRILLNQLKIHDMLSFTQFCFIVNKPST